MMHNQIKYVNVVLDVGSYHTFAGQAGLQSPKFASNSFFVSNSSKKGQYQAGNQALHSQNPNKNVYSIFEDVSSDGKINQFKYNIDRFERFVQTILFDNLELQDCGISLLIAEDMSTELEPHLISKQRRKMIDYFLQKMQLSSIAFVKKPVLSSFALGSTNSVVLDSGHSFTHCSIIEDGFCVFNKTLKFGGSTLHNLVKQLIQEKNNNQEFSISLQNSGQYRKEDIMFHKIYEITQILNTFQYIDPNSTMAPEDQSIFYELPDGNTVQIRRQEIEDPFVNYPKFWKRYIQNINEQYPNFVNQNLYQILSSYRGLQKFIYSTIDQHLSIIDNKNHTVASISSLTSDYYDVHRKRSNQLSYSDLMNNIILTGGNLFFNDLAYQITQGIKGNGGKTIEGVLNLNRDENGNQTVQTNSLSWIGGSILSSIEGFNNFWIKNSEWKQLGTHIVASRSSDPVRAQIEEQHHKNSKKLQLINKKCV